MATYVVLDGRQNWNCRALLPIWKTQSEAEATGIVNTLPAIYPAPDFTFYAAVNDDAISGPERAIFNEGLRRLESFVSAHCAPCTYREGCLDCRERKTADIDLNTARVFAALQSMTAAAPDAESPNPSHGVSGLQSAPAEIGARDVLALRSMIRQFQTAAQDFPDAKVHRVKMEDGQIGLFMPSVKAKAKFDDLVAHAGCLLEGESDARERMLALILAEPQANALPVYDWAEASSGKVEYHTSANAFELAALAIERLVKRIDGEAAGKRSVTPPQEPGLPDAELRELFNALNSIEGSQRAFSMARGINAKLDACIGLIQYSSEVGHYAAMLGIDATAYFRWKAILNQVVDLPSEDPRFWDESRFTAVDEAWPDASAVLRKLRHAATTGGMAKAQPATAMIAPGVAASGPCDPAVGDGRRSEAPAKEQALGKGITWQEAKRAGEAHCRRNPFPGVNALAKIVGCSQATMSKAIKRSPGLRARLAQREADRKSVSAGAMTEAVAESAEQTRECDPAEAASSDEAMTRLLAQCESTDQRAKIQQMTPEKQRELIAMVGHDPEAHGLDETPRVRGPKR